MKNKTLHSCRPAAWALAVGACLLLLGAPARAQWLVQDENLYKELKASGSGKGNFSQSSRNLKSSIKKGAKNALGLNKTKFEELALDTEGLLDKSMEDSDAKLKMVAKMEQTAGGTIANGAIGKVLGVLGKNTYAGDAAAFFGDMPNCNASGNTEVFVQCMHMRNILGSQLKEIQAISKNLESRNEALQGIMGEKYKTAGELQQKQYEISLLQAVIANDQMRLQTALAAYQSMRDLYKEKYNEALHKRQYGGSSVSNKVAQLKAGVVGAATFAATKATVDSTMNANIFKKR